MATFYGRLQGNRGEATRCGSKDSGIRATAESWGSVLRVQHHAFSDGRLLASFTIEGKYNGVPVLSAELDADALVEHARDPHVAARIEAVGDAFRDLRHAVNAAEVARELENS